MEIEVSKKLVVVLLLAIFIAIFGVTEYTTKPSFCKSCHVMEPYVHKWEISVHNTVPCLECHSEPGFWGYVKTKLNAAQQPLHYLTGTYTMPRADVPNENCIKCHSKILEQKVGEKFVKFPHQKHIVEQNLTCNHCHTGAAVSHIAVDMPICLECHNEKKAPFKCEMCHVEISERVYTWSKAKVTFDHKKHLDRKITCELCHATYVEERKDLYMENLCGYCHNTKSKEKCTYCHQEPPPLIFMV